MKQHFLTLSIILYLSIDVASQTVLTGIGTRWADEFTEWIIYTDIEDLTGEMKMTWQIQNDWFNWDYSLDNSSGSIRLKWKDNPNLWEIVGEHETITARTVWTNDFREWRITNNDISLTLRSKWGSKVSEWELKDVEHGFFSIYFAFDNDPREWDIIDELDEDISLEMKMALVFIAIYHSTPKL